MLIHFKNEKLRRFLFYLDQNTTKGDVKRERVYKSGGHVEETPPMNAPNWTKSGYDGPLKSPVREAISKYTSK